MLSTQTKTYMVNVRGKRCGQSGCNKHPSYGKVGVKAEVYASHVQQGMVDLENRPGALVLPAVLGELVQQWRVGVPAAVLVPATAAEETVLLHRSRQSQPRVVGVREAASEPA